MKSNNKFQKLEFENFFTGQVIAEGYMNFFYPKKNKKKLKVIFTGSFKNEKLKLIEKYFEDDLKTLRKWQFEKISKSKFIGNGQNILNPFVLHIKNDFLEMNYEFKTKYKSLNFFVNVKDQMYVINENTIINYTKISKFLIPIANSLLLYKKL